VRERPPLIYVVAVPSITFGAAFLILHDLHVSLLWSTWIGVAFSCWMVLLLWACAPAEPRERRGVNSITPRAARN
jgi:hypothetical protein